MSSDARRDADRWLLWYAGGEQLTEDGRKNAVRTATLVIRALLASEPAKAPFVSRNEEWGLRPDFTTAGVTAPPAGAEVREAAEVLAEWDKEEVRRASPSVRRLVRALSALAVKPSAQPAGDAVREAAERLRRIVTNHDARITERGVLVYGQPCMSTGFVEAIEWLSRYDAALRGGQKGGE